MRDKAGCLVSTPKDRLTPPHKWSLIMKRQPASQWVLPYPLSPPPSPWFGAQEGEKRALHLQTHFLFICRAAGLSLCPPGSRSWGWGHDTPPTWPTQLKITFSFTKPFFYLLSVFLSQKNLLDFFYSFWIGHFLFCIPLTKKTLSCIFLNYNLRFIVDIVDINNFLILWVFCCFFLCCILFSKWNPVMHIFINQSKIYFWLSFIFYQ